MLLVELVVVWWVLRTMGVVAAVRRVPVRGSMLVLVCLLRGLRKVVRWVPASVAPLFMGADVCKCALCHGMPCGCTFTNLDDLHERKCMHACMLVRMHPCERMFAPAFASKVLKPLIIVSGTRCPAPSLAARCCGTIWHGWCS